MGIEFDRAVAKGLLVKWLIPTVMVILPSLIGFAGYFLLSSDNKVPLAGNQSDNFFLSAIEVYLDPSNKPIGVDGGARLFYLVVGTVGLFLLNGLMVSMLVSWFESRRDRWTKGNLHYCAKALGNFSIVIGGNEMVPDLVWQILKEDTVDYVLVMTNRDVATLRKRLISKLGKGEEKVVIYYGERTSMEDLRLLHLTETKNDIYVIGEQLDVGQIGSHHDVKNMDCVQKMAELLQGCNEKKICRVMFEYQSTFSVFQFADVCMKIAGVLDFKPFNYYETWAQNVLVCKELDLKDNTSTYLPLEGKEPLTVDSEDSVHLIVVGMSRMGIALAVEAAHLAHYPNYISKGKCTRITFVDSQAQKEMNFFLGHYKELFAVSRWRYMEADMTSFYGEGSNLENLQWREPRKDDAQSPYKDSDGYSLGNQLVDVEWQFIQGDLEMPSVQNFIKHETQKRNSRLTIAVCIPQDNASLAASLYLPDEVYENESNVVQVLVYQPYGDAMRQSFIDESKDLYKSYKLFAKLRAFGMMDGCYSLERQVVMKTACDAFNNEYGKTALAQIPGRNQLRKQFKMETIKAGKSLAAKLWSNYYTAIHLWTKLRSVRYDGVSETMDEQSLALLAAVEHLRWNMEQLLLGYAPLKNEEQKALMAKRVTAQGMDVSYEELKELNADNSESVSKECYRKAVEWLNTWKDYDDMKEKLKADMSHTDICSLDVLERIDKEAIEYDRVMVGILPTIYKQIANKENGK